MRTDLIGIIFSSIGESFVRELTEIRCMGSVPIGGRYRMIDFTLSNMVNSGISKVGITTRANYRSLMDHLGSGKPWDLSRKKGGIYFFPPYINQMGGSNSTRIMGLASLLPFLEHSTEEYVILSDCDYIANINIEKMAESHISGSADITIAYAESRLPRAGGERMVFGFDKNNRINEILIDPDTTENCNVSLNLIMMKRALLVDIVKDAMSRNYTSLNRDVFQRRLFDLKICGWKFCGYSRIVDSMKKYLSVNMELFDRDIRRDLFKPESPIYTKICDEMPAKYGVNSYVKNSLVADGCVIEGEVENCVLFRGVKISKGAKVSNCVVMQGSEIAADADVSYVIIDKDARITNGRVLAGFESYPAFISKGSEV